jgi:hypothetical protein
VRRAAAILSSLALGLALACTVDQVVGSNVATDGGTDGGPDAGTPICPGSDATCDPVCGSQICQAGCTGIHDCIVNCSGTSCSFSCERDALTCSPTCDPGPCQMSCVNNGEQVDCTMDCNPAQTCKADCHNGLCTVACGELSPATICDAGVYSCSGSCPP